MRAWRHGRAPLRTRSVRLRQAIVALCMLCAALLYWQSSNAGTRASTAKPASPTKAAPSSRTTLGNTPLWVVAARAQIGVTRIYDPTYVRLPYPGGDVPQDRGVCTDVVIRALRTQRLDLQKVVHEDMRAHFAKYPQKWRLRKPDSNIDHRRVPNLQTWFTRLGWSLPATRQAGNYHAGDMVTWMLPGNLPHIGIISERKTREGRPLVIHNIGRGVREEDILFAHPVTGHYRPRLP